MKDIILGQLQGLELGQLLVLQAGQDALEPLKGRVDLVHAFALARVCRQPPLLQDGQRRDARQAVVIARPARAIRHAVLVLFRRRRRRRPSVGKPPPRLYGNVLSKIITQLALLVVAVLGDGEVRQVAGGQP